MSLNLNGFNDWVMRHPEAAADLFEVLSAGAHVPGTDNEDKSEAWAQQQVRFKAGELGAGVLWRNNVGSTPAQSSHQCPACRHEYVENHTPLRYGIANDSAQMNKMFASSDLIGIRQYTVQPQDVGRVLGLFWAVEVKAPRVKIDLEKSAHQKRQAAFGALVESFNGVFQFSHGDIDLQLD